MGSGRGALGFSLVYKATNDISGHLGLWGLFKSKLQEGKVSKG